MKIKKFDYPVFKIVGNGMVSIPDLAEGRLIPAVIIDALNNKMIPDLLELHKSVLPGDTKSQWGNKVFDNNNVTLHLEFLKPMTVSFGIEYNYPKHFSLIDGIIQSKGLFLITGKKGDKVSENLADGILIEIPNNGFETGWENILLKTLKSKYRHENMSKKDSAETAKKHIQAMREVWNIRRTNE